VDLGVGTGGLTLVASPFCRRVVAVDVSPAMLASLRDAVGRLRLSNVECVQAGFLTYQHTGEPADFVYSRHALHQIPDFWKAVALRRMRSMLRPEVSCAYATWCFRSTSTRPIGLLRRGFRRRASGRALAGIAPNSKPTYARNTAPLAGCWSRCWNMQVLRYVELRMTRQGSMPRTCASPADLRPLGGLSASESLRLYEMRALWARDQHAIDGTRPEPG
jgi:ubiquinone/menaquinone biosynthesis C-methylase UbiE